MTTSLGIVAAAKEWTGNSRGFLGHAGAVDTFGRARRHGQRSRRHRDWAHFTLSVTQANDAAHSLVVNSSIAKVEIVSGGVLTLGGNLTIDAGTFQIDSGGLLKEIATSSIDHRLIYQQRHGRSRRRR